MAQRTLGRPGAGRASGVSRAGRGFASRWAWLPTLVVGIVLYEIVRLTVVDTQNPNLVPALILLGAAVVPVAFVSFMSGRRLAFAVSGGVVGLTALIGGVVGVVAAGLLEYDTVRHLRFIPLLLVGLIEETAKLILPVTLLLFLRSGRRAADGLVVGVASGAGFAALETMGYAFVALIASRGDLSAVNDVLFERGVLSPAAHMAWTGLTAATLWLAAAEGWRRRGVVRFVVVFVVAVCLHAIWDSVGQLWAYGVLALVSLGLLAWTTHQLADPGLSRR